jgi:indolepyruvate ferredoxin oxidoreductase, beta subunit
MSREREFNLLIAGVGGQGTITASHLLGKAALTSGIDIIIGEIFGMSMRGGPVVSHVRMGKGDLSPITPRGRGDVLLGFEALESLRAALRFMRPGGIIIVNTKRLYPVDVSLETFTYPPTETLLKDLKKIGKVVAFDATGIAKEAGNVVAANMVMVGALAGTGLLPVPLPTLVGAIEKTVPRGVEVSLKAFQMGLDTYKKLAMSDN